MSRVANNPVSLPSGVEVKLDGQALAVKGGKGSLELAVHSLVEVQLGDGVLTFAARNSSK
jgi:large subunit ribosomal protein L6